MTTPIDGQSTALLLQQRMDYLQKEIDANKREAEADLKRVQEKADADARANAARIAAIEAERTKALIWGISTLGAAVLLMGGWILSKLFTGSIKW